MHWQNAHTQSYYRLLHSSNDICDCTERLMVNCSGVSVIDKPFRSYSENGRHDFYLMYLVRGALTVWSGEHEFSLRPGDAIIYPPEISYGYHLPPEEHLVYLWAHFTGSEAEALLTHRGLGTAEVYHLGSSEAIEEDFERIHRLFITRPAYFLEEAASQLEILLTHIARAASSTEKGKPERLQASLNHLNRHYAEPLHLDELAGMEYLSPSRYSALFRQIIGCSPQQYLIDLRLKNARELLLSTDLSVSEVARSVGYDDALYFSRLFRTHMGSAPSALRKRP